MLRFTSPQLLSCLAIGVSLLGVASTVAHAATVHLAQPYVFSTVADQSFWGGGTGYSFGSRQNYGWSSVNFGWDIGASTGTVAATVAGNLLVDYRPVKELPGTVDLSMNFAGTPDGSSFSSALGAWARVNATLLVTLPLLDYGFDLQPQTSFTAAPVQTVRASANDAVAGVGVDLGLLSTGVNLGIEQNNLLTLQAITGKLAYQQRGSSLVQSMPFAISGSADTVVQPYLSSAGTWDFWLTDLDVNAQFAADFDLDLRFYETHVDGLQWCTRRVWFVTLAWPCGLSYDTNEFELASIDLYNGQAFMLDFAPVADGQRFSIEVVPVPPTLPLALLGLGAAALFSRRRELNK